MYLTTILAVLIGHIVPPSISASDVKTKIRCLYKDTVNLTNYQAYDNGSYLYESILIPPERQHVYNYQITNSFPLKVAVPSHRRACVCDIKTCLKLCCEKDEFLSNMGKCEKMTSEMNVSWELPMSLESGKIKNVNVLQHFIPQVGVICEDHKALVKDKHLWNLEENGVLNISRRRRINTHRYCLAPYLIGESEYVISPFACRLLPKWRKFLHLYAALINVMFVTPTILIYAAIKELRETLGEKLLICYFVSLAAKSGLVAFFKVSGIHFSPTDCHILGFATYTLYISSILWLTILCYHFWENFSKMNVETNLRKDFQQLIRYTLYVWSITITATCVCIYLEFSPNVKAKYKPGLDEIVCWLQVRKRSGWLYLFGPSFLIVFMNLVAFIRFITIVYRTRRDAARLRRNQKIFKENILTIVRLLLVLGVPRFFIIISYFIPKGSSGDLFATIADIINIFQGTSIFSCFVLRPKVWHLVTKRFRRSSSIP